MDFEPINRRGLLMLLTPLIVVFAVFYLYPLLQLMLTSFQGKEGWTLEHYRELANDPVVFNVFLRTGRLALTVTVVTLVLAYPIAFLLVARGGRLSTILLAAVLFPFWISVLVRTYAWMVLLGRQGIVNTLLVSLGITERPIALLYNQIGVHIGMVYVLLPLMVLPIYSSMQNFDPNLVRAAHSLGCGPIETLRRIYIPLTLPGVAAGSVLVFMVSLGFFITPAMVGGSRDITISMLVDKMINAQLNWSSGAAISTILLLLTATTFAVCGRLLQNNSKRRTA